MKGGILTALKAKEFNEIDWEKDQVIGKDDFEPSHVVEVHERIAAGTHIWLGR